MQIWKEHLNRDEFAGGANGQDFLHLVYFTNSIVEFMAWGVIQIYVLASETSCNVIISYII